MTTEDMRDLMNGVRMYGEGHIVRKLGSRWVVQFRTFGFPTVFRTKTAACAKAREWAKAIEMRMRAA